MGASACMATSSWAGGSPSREEGGAAPGTTARFGASPPPAGRAGGGAAPTLRDLRWSPPSQYGCCSCNVQAAQSVYSVVKDDEPRWGRGASLMDVPAHAEGPGLDQALDERALLRSAYLLAGDWHEAEDLVQEATLRWLEATSRGVLVTHPNAYVRRSVVTIFLNRRRRLAVWRRTVPVLVTSATADDSQAQAVDRDLLWRAVQRLPSRQRAAVVLRYYEDLSFHSTAQALGCPEATARSLVHRALKKLRVAVQDKEI